MSFNKQDYISASNKTPTQRFIEESTTVTVRGQRQNVADTVADAAKLLLLGGISLESIRAGLSAQTRSMTSNADETYFALAGLEVSRTAGKSLSDIRRASTQSTDQYFRQSNPTTRIEMNRKRRNSEILTAI